ncbi:MAG: hypothetical protein WBP79_00880 [Candidatus Acidiferrales bacterium]
MKTLSTFRREVGHGGIVPRGYQMAWYEPRRRVGVYFPAPLHWILRALRDFGYRLRVALRAPGMECAEVFEMQRTQRERQRLAEEYARGYMAGWRECFEACLDAVEDEISRVDDVWEIGAWLTGADTPREKN